MKDVHEETKVRIACYMAHSNDEWMKVAWEREYNKEGPLIKKEAEKALREMGINVEIKKECIKLEREEMEGDWKGK